MVIINRICYIVGSCRTYDEICFKKKENDFVIAADGGYDLLKKSGIKADVLIGDFDSITSLPEGVELIRHPVEKDDTDSFLAYRYGYEKGYRNFVVSGSIGGRFDHTMANIQMLYNMAKNNARGFLVGEGTVVSVIYNSSISFSKYNKGNFGVFAYSDVAEGVTIKNARYNIENATITPNIPIGVSNEFIGGNTDITVSNGALLIVWYETQQEFSERLNRYLEV